MRFSLLLTLCLFTPSAAAQDPALQLFNGLDLTGWDGDSKHWSVEDGCLVGRSTEDAPLEHSIYLFSDIEAGDFELEFDYLIIGGNSGIQYRSERLANDDVAGYQADIEDGPSYSGILYESAGRGVVAQRGERLKISSDGNRSKGVALGDASELQDGIRTQAWNHYRVVAKGAHLVHQINGQTMIDVVDEEDGRARAQGLFALQLHQGPPMEVRYRNFKLRNITAPQQPEWIWSSAPNDVWDSSLETMNQQLWLHYSFDLSQSATLSGGEITCDNSFQAWLDEHEIASGNDWATPSAVNSGQTLAAGTHHFSVYAKNEGGPAGLAARLKLTLADGSNLDIVSSSAWNFSSTQPAAWPIAESHGFSAETWKSVFSFGAVGTHTGPWGNVMAPRIATPASNFVLPEGFEATLVHSATDGQGSWASMTFGAKGEIYVSPERGKLLRFNFPLGHAAAPQVETLDTPIHSSQGLLYAFDSLYANVAGSADSDGGLHRLRDLDDDGIFEDHQHLAKYGPASEHGSHGIALGPDNKLYVVIGNHTKVPTNLAPSSPFQNIAEDVLLPRIWDPRGHAHGMYAPAAVVMRTDKDANEWELIAGGMRNPYDLAFAPDGELFTYDADMEWDIGTPWYRAPRVVHVIPGSESGWRSGSAKWPAEYPDSLPAVVETGPASPVGITFGTNSHFPQQWANRLFLADWAYGRIIAVELSPKGASYGGEVLDFMSGKPMAVTDLEFGPDGALWFTTGGRGSQSGLYRVTYTKPMAGKPNTFHSLPNEDVLLRRKLEGAEVSAADLSTALLSADRTLRYAARLNLERRTNVDWMNLDLGVKSSASAGEILLAIARVGDAREREFAYRHILASNFKDASLDSQWLMVRTAMLLRTRSGEGQTTSADAEMAEFFSRGFPSADPALNREIARLLVAVEAPNLPALLIEQLKKAAFQEEQLHYAILLRLVKNDWSKQQRLWYFTWLRQSHGMIGGFSLTGFLSAIESEALSLVPDNQKQSLLASLPAPSTAAIQPPVIARAFQQEWTVMEAFAALNSNNSLPDLDRGEELFRSLSCIQCHRIGSDGGSLGPDLTAVGNRFGKRDLLEAIIEPQKALSDQFTLVPMPSTLLNTASKQDLQDLIAFLIAGAQLD
jgi:cytochrome c551/c552